LFIFESEVIEYACRVRTRNNQFFPTSRMSSAPPPPPPITPPSDSNKNSDPSAPTGSSSPEGVAMDVTPDAPGEETWDDLPEEILTLSTDEILTRTRLIDNDIKVLFE
jgi:26S proteasome regulatory subunit T5